MSKRELPRRWIQCNEPLFIRKPHQCPFQTNSKPGSNETTTRKLDQKIQAKSPHIDTYTIENNNQFQNINQPRPFIYNSQYRSTTPSTESFRTGLPNIEVTLSDQISRPEAQAREGCNHASINRINLGSTNIDRTFKWKQECLLRHIFQLRRQVTRFVIFAGTQTTRRANATVAAETIQKVPHFHSQENKNF